MIKLNFPLILISLILFLFSSCGGGSQSLSLPSSEFQEWKEKLPVSVEELPEYWKQNEQGKWPFKWYKSDLHPESQYEFKDDIGISPDRIFQEHMMNCHLFAILMRAVYGGEYIFLEMGEQDHVVLLFDGDGKFFILSYPTRKWEMWPELICLKATNKNEVLDEIQFIFKPIIKEMYKERK